MDEFDATSMLFSRIKSIDPENASKIMGYLLIQDVNKIDLFRLATGPETLLQTLIFRAKTHLGLSSNAVSTPTSPSPNPFSGLNSNTNNTNNNVKNNPFAQLSPRITNNGFLDFAKNSRLSDPNSSPFLSFDNIRSGSCSVPSVSRIKNEVVVGDSGNSSRNSGNDFMEELQFNDYLSFLDDPSKTEDLIDLRSQFSREVTNWGQDMNNGDIHLHRRSFSASDVRFGTEDASFSVGYRPCLYFTRGFCKNGDNCKFAHGGFGENIDVNGVIVGSPSKMDGLYLQREEMMRMKAAKQQRLAASQFAAGVSPLPYDKCMDLLLQHRNDIQNDHQRAAASALMLSDESYQFGQSRAERNDFLALGLAEKMNSANRQIYLTFPADSSFKDEDVSNYFSIFGPVQDVRIPYQQKRMFGFVTFVYPETVKLILARGNPHFICDSRVLVKPYKEKGKIVDKKQQQFESGNMSPCSSPSGVDSRDPYDLHFGARMLYNSQELMLRRKLEEQAELQQAIEFQRRRLLNLQLPNLKNHSVHHHQRSLSMGSPITDVNQNVVLPSVGINQDVFEVDNSTANKSSNINAATEQHSLSKVNAVCIPNNGSNNTKEESSKQEGSHESSIEHILPFELFASAGKSAEVQTPDVSTCPEVNGSTAVSATPSSSENNLDMPTASKSEVALH